MTTFIAHQQLTAAQLNAAFAYNVVAPTGGDDTAMLNTAFASSAAKPVFLSPGVYQVSAPLTVPSHGIVVGEDIHVFEQFDGGTTYQPNTVLQAITSGGWTSGTAVLKLSNWCKVRGFTVVGFFGGGTSYGVNGVDFSSTNVAIMKQIGVLYCELGFNNTTNGPNSQLFELDQCYVGNCANFALYLSAVAGFISDFKIRDCWFNANHGEIRLDKASYGQISGCRLEDGGTNFAVQMTNCTDLVLSEIYFDREPGCLHLNAVTFSTFWGMRLNSYAGAFYDISFSGNNSLYNKFGLLNFGSSSAAASFLVSSVSVAGSTFDSLSPLYDYGTNALYADAATEAAIAPWVISRGSLVSNNAFITLTAVSNTFTPDLYRGRNFSITLADAVTNTIANPTGAAVMLGQLGTIQVVGSAAGTGTLAWGTLFKNLPALPLTAGAINYMPYVMSPAGNVILFAPVANAGG